jgi:hypothetical protein
VCGHIRTADACAHPSSTREKGIIASIRKRNDWDDPDADKEDKEDERALLLAFVAIIVLFGVAFLLM